MTAAATASASPTVLKLSISTIPSVFADITPLPQDDGPYHVCVIDYKPDFIIAHDYLRAILNNNETTERALALTGMCLAFNSANYTVWQYRRHLLQELQSNIQAELAWSAQLGGENPKNYQLWHHRRAMLERSWKKNTDADNGVDLLMEQELEYIATVLQEDGKNYHAWSHRQWILRTATTATTGNASYNNLWDKERTFVERCITQDVRNNSAWNQRWFVAHYGTKNKLTRDQATSEAVYTMHQCKLDPYNESPWRYLMGLLKEVPQLVEEYQTKTIEIKSVLIGADRDPEGCNPLNSATIEMLEMMNTKDSLDQAIVLAKGMGSTHDTIRVKYWNLRERELEAKIMA